MLLPLASPAQAPREKMTTTTSTTVEPDKKPASMMSPVADSSTDGTVSVGGKEIAYKAVAGTITVGASEPQDAMIGLDGKWLADTGVETPSKPEDQPPTARIFYAAYFAKGANVGTRPITFIYNGGPGSATMYLHMGSFGPKRILTTDTQHDLGGPYKIVPNDYSLLDVSDLVFIDAPGCGFSRVFGKEAGKQFYSVDGDVHAFDRFIRRFLTKYNRWTAPKYLFGESYGTPRAAALSWALQADGVDLNGVVLLSQILSYSDSVDGPASNPGVDDPYFLALPSYAATAWYHHRVPNQPADLTGFLHEVEQFSIGDYATALRLGSDLPAARKQAIAAKMESYTGVPAAYWVKADLRVSGGEFAKELLTEQGLTTGRLDSRYEGPDINPMSASSDYDPFSNAITSAYQAAMNDYARTTLHFGENLTYKPSAREPGWSWDFAHRLPESRGGGGGSYEALNTMPDLAATMKHNTKMKVLLMGGYFDLGTLYFSAEYQMKHLPMPQSLQANIQYHFEQTGHMVYVNVPVLKDLHDTTAAFIRASENGK
jgi:carboxypeptidase C (cathepsin A)